MQIKTHKLSTTEGIEVTFRDIRPEEALLLKQWMDSSEIAQTIATGFAQSVESEEEWIDSLYKDKDKIHIGVEVEGKLIGSWGVHLKGHLGKTGSVIGPKEMRGKGIAKLSHAFRTWLLFTQLDLLITKLESEVVWDEKSGLLNHASRKSLESVGYMAIGIAKGSIFRNGALIDKVLLECYNPFFHKVTDLESKEYINAIASTQYSIKWVEKHIVRI